MNALAHGTAHGTAHGPFSGSVAGSVDAKRSEGKGSHLTSPDLILHGATSHHGVELRKPRASDAMMPLRAMGVAA